MPRDRGRGRGKIRGRGRGHGRTTKQVGKPAPEGGIAEVITTLHGLQEAVETLSEGCSRAVTRWAIASSRALVHMLRDRLCPFLVLRCLCKSFLI